MEFVDLRTGYLLTGFDDFESAFSATEQLCGKGFKVAYLNEANHVRDFEAKNFARCFGSMNDRKYQNYHFTLQEQAKARAADSLKTAVEVLEKKCSRSVKYILVLDTIAVEQQVS